LIECGDFLVFDLKIADAVSIGLMTISDINHWIDRAAKRVPRRS
jgi:hypothetical protein